MTAEATWGADDADGRKRKGSNLGLTRELGHPYDASRILEDYPEAWMHII